MPTQGTTPIQSHVSVDRASLIARIQGGDPDASEELYRALQTSFRSFLWRRIGPEAEDVTQEAFMIVYQAAQRGAIRDAERLMSFAYTVFHRQVCARVGTLIRTRQCVSTGRLTLRDPCHDPERLAIDGESINLAHRVLAGLPAAEREILERSILGEQATTQIVSEMHLDEHQVRRLSKSGYAVRFRWCPRSSSL